MIFLLNPSVFAATVIVSLTGLTTDSVGNYALNNTSIGYSVAGSPSSQKWQFSSNGTSLSGDIGGATGTTFTPIVGSNVTNYHFIRVAVTISSVEYYSPWTQVANLPATTGSTLSLSFAADIAVSNVNLLQNWSLNGNVVASFSILETLPVGISSSFNSSQVLLSGTPTDFSDSSSYTLSVFDTRGRLVSTSFNLGVTGVRTANIPVTTYALTAPAPITGRLSLTNTVDSELIGTGTGDFSLAITSPAPYIGGPYSVDLSVEGGSANLNFDSILTAPQNFVRPNIVRTAIGPGGSAIKIGDTFTVSPGLWVYDSADTATVSQTGQWRLDGTPIGGATGLSYTATAAGSLTYLETLSGAGTTRTSLSAAVTVAAIERTANIPVTTYTIETPTVTTTRGTWDVDVGNGTYTINSFPAAPTLPAWNIDVGDGSYSVITYPGGS